MIFWNNENKTWKTFYDFKYEDILYSVVYDNVDSAVEKAIRNEKKMTTKELLDLEYVFFLNQMGTHLKELVVYAAEKNIDIKTCYYEASRDVLKNYYDDVVRSKIPVGKNYRYEELRAWKRKSFKLDVLIRFDLIHNHDPYNYIYTPLDEDNLSWK